MSTVAPISGVLAWCFTKRSPVSLRFRERMRSRFSVRSAQRIPSRCGIFVQETPEGADQIVSHALEKDLSQRYQSASESSRDLSDVLLQLSAPSLPAADRASRFSPRILPTAIVLLLLLAGSVMWLDQRSERRHWAREEAIPAIAKLKSATNPSRHFCY